MSQKLCLYSETVRRMLDTQSVDRVFFEKDLLACGCWEGDDCPKWEVDESILDQIVHSFRLQKSLGIRIPLVYEHANLARDRVGEIDELWRDGCKLMARCWAAKDDDVKHLQHVSPEVSVGVEENWRDGAGNVYPLALEHVAIVNNPVCHGQGPFRRLSLKGKSKMTKRRLAEGDPPVPPEPGSSGPADDATEATVVEFAAILKEFLDVEMPDGVDTIKEMKLVLAERKKAQETDDGSAEPPAEMIDTMPAGDIPLAMRLSVIGALRRAKRTLKLEVDTNRKLAESKAKDDFVAELDSFVESGAITEADKQTFMTDGAKVGYSKTMLLGLKKGAGQAYANGPGQRRLGVSGRVPPQTPLPVHGQRPTDEECKKTADSWLGRKS